MFDLSKDLDRYKGVTPYANEHYGVYKPLLGWRSALTKKWLVRGGPVGDPRIKSVLDGRVKPGPTGVINPHPLEFLATPLEPGAGLKPWRVLIKKDLGSEIVGVVGRHLLTWLNDHAGTMPSGAEWTGVVDINVMLDADTGDMKAVNDIHRTRVFAQYNGVPQSASVMSSTRRTETPARYISISVSWGSSFPGGGDARWSPSRRSAVAASGSSG
jgi:hypothetical protein